MLKWVKLFNPYDFVFKKSNAARLEKLKPYYEDLVTKYLPAELKF